MEERFAIVTAGRQTDFSAFWRYFDNYIVTAAHHEFLDEQVLGWYLTDDYHKEFYRRIFDSRQETDLLLFYRRPVSQIQKARNSRGTLGKLMQHRMRSSSHYLDRQPLRYESSGGECVGFCLMDHSHEGGHCAWILALCLEGVPDNLQKAELWAQVERHMKLQGIHKVETASYQNPRFWTANGFHSVSAHVMSKKI